MMIGDLIRLSATEPFPEAHSYLPCSPDTEDSIHPSRRKRARFYTLPPTDLSAIGVIFAPLAAAVFLRLTDAARLG